MMTRRSLLAMMACSAAVAAPWPGWSSDVMAQLTPTFATIGGYRIFEADVPDASRVAGFVPDNYPASEKRRAENDRPLRRLDFEQVQSLVWLRESVESFRQPASTWTQPPVLTPRNELNSRPILQNQAMAVHIRHILKLSPSDKDGPWRDYFLSRLRPDGTFNNTPASDGTGGHVMNTRWGLLAAEHLAMKLPEAPGLADWVRSCQMASGGFTYSPKATIGAVDDLAYTWCALQVLAHLGATIPNRALRRMDLIPRPRASRWSRACRALLGDRFA